MRSFFENVAKSRNLDPLIPETWYKISRQEVEDILGGITILGHFRGGYVNTLLQIFPDIGLEEEKFEIASKCCYQISIARLIYCYQISTGTAWETDGIGSIHLQKTEDSILLKQKTGIPFLRPASSTLKYGSNFLNRC